MVWQRCQSPAGFEDYYTWEFERPAPALPNSYFWTWDHSTNWVLDDPGNQWDGCYNRYLKRPETYLEDYRRLIDLAAGLGIKGIVIWGFLRDSHGGVDYAKRIAEYASSRGVAIMPGVGITWYGGIYYEGDHRYNLQTFLRDHPDAFMLGEDGQPQRSESLPGLYPAGGPCPIHPLDLVSGACPAHPAFEEWLQEALDWLYTEFAIGGVNLENGDFCVDHHPFTRARRKDWPADDPEVFFFQGLSYQQALKALQQRLPATLGTYATYTGFTRGEFEALDCTSKMGQHTPAMFNILPQDSIAQWTLTGMLLPTPLPLSAYLDNGAPSEAFDNPNWPVDLVPPAKRSVGFIHQGSQWHGDRYQCMISSIKEACLRAHRAGLEGISIHGEVSNRHIPAALNYLAFSHFIHWPEDSLRDFGRKTLGPVLGSEADGEEYIEILAQWDANTLPKDQWARTYRNCTGAEEAIDCYQRHLFWAWLGHTVRNNARNITGFSLGPG